MSLTIVFDFCTKLFFVLCVENWIYEQELDQCLKNVIKWDFLSYFTTLLLCCCTQKKILSSLIKEPFPDNVVSTLLQWVLVQFFSLPFLTLVLMGNCCHSVSEKKQLLFLTKLLLNSLKESSWWLISRNTQKRSWFLNYKLLFEVHKHKEAMNK